MLVCLFSVSSLHGSQEFKVKSVHQWSRDQQQYTRLPFKKFSIDSQNNRIYLRDDNAREKNINLKDYLISIETDEYLVFYLKDRQRMQQLCPLFRTNFYVVPNTENLEENDEINWRETKWLGEYTIKINKKGVENLKKQLTSIFYIEVNFNTDNNKLVIKKMHKPAQANDTNETSNKVAIATITAIVLSAYTYNRIKDYFSNERGTPIKKEDKKVKKLKTENEPSKPLKIYQVTHKVMGGILKPYIDPTSLKKQRWLYSLLL